MRMFALLLCVLAGITGVVSAAPQDRFSFRLSPSLGHGVEETRLHIQIDRWASDRERDRVRRYLEDYGVDNLFNAFWGTPATGRMEWPGGLEYAIRYARSAPRPDGGTDVVVVLDRPLWLWWKDTVSGDERPVVVHLQLDAGGRGNGRISPAPSARPDAVLGLTLATPPEAPALIADVRAEEAAGS